MIHGDVLRLDLESILDGLLLTQTQSQAGTDGPRCLHVFICAEQVQGEVCITAEPCTVILLRSSQAPQRVTAIANLPYYITTDCLKRMLSMGQRLSDLYFMLQDEVAQRLLCRTPGGPDYRCGAHCMLRL